MQCSGVQSLPLQSSGSTRVCRVLLESFTCLAIQPSRCCLPTILRSGSFCPSAPTPLRRSLAMLQQSRSHLLDRVGLWCRTLIA